MKQEIASFLLLSTSLVRSAPCPSGCPDGSSLPLADKIVHIPPFPPLTCAQLEAFGPSLGVEEGSEQCDQSLRMTSLCGCQRPSDSCDLCPNGFPAPNTATELPEFGKFIRDSLYTCELIEAYLHSFPKEDEFCLASQRAAAATCGCPETEDFDSADPSTDPGDTLWIGPSDGTAFDFSTFGNKSRAMLTQLHRVLRSSAVMSICGAILVIQDTVRFKKRRRNLYNQIVAIMAGFDIIYSLSLALINIPRPVGTALSSGTERGNAATCTAQGFMVQWSGLTSLLLNASLSTYYLLVIVYRARKSKLDKASKWMLGIPICIGFIFACIAIPFITQSMIGCAVTPPNELLTVLEIGNFRTSWAPYLCLVVVPGYLVLAYTTIALGRVYWYVRDVSTKAGRWRSTRRASQFFRAKLQNAEPSSTVTANIDSGSMEVKRKRTRKKKRNATSKLQNEVFIQCAMYLAALYLVWFILLWIAIDANRYLGGHYALWNFLFFLQPLQGFLNSAIYFRPRLSRSLKKLWKEHRIKVSCSSCRKDRAITETPPEVRTSKKVENEWASIRDSEPAADILVQNEESVVDMQQSEEGEGEWAEKAFCDAKRIDGGSDEICDAELAADILVQNEESMVDMQQSEEGEGEWAEKACCDAKRIDEDSDEMDQPTTEVDISAEINESNGDKLSQAGKDCLVRNECVLGELSDDSIQDIESLSRKDEDSNQ